MTRSVVVYHKIVDADYFRIFVYYGLYSRNGFFNGCFTEKIVLRFVKYAYSRNEDKYRYGNTDYRVEDIPIGKFDYDRA